MYRNLSVLLLCGVMIWYAAAQVNETKTDLSSYGIRVGEQTVRDQTNGDAVGGEIRMTAALRSLEESGSAVVRFVLEGSGYTRRSSVVLTPKCRNADGLYAASAVYENLLSGTYTLRVESASGAVLDYILAENGDRSRYEIQGDTITFELSEDTSSGSAWFMMQEGEACTS